MANMIEGHLSAKGKSFAIVTSRFNEFISSKLLGGSLDCIKRHGGDDNKVDVAWVPGAYEIPLVAKKLANSNKFLDISLNLLGVEFLKNFKPQKSKDGI